MSRKTGISIPNKAAAIAANTTNTMIAKTAPRNALICVFRISSSLQRYLTAANLARASSTIFMKRRPYSV